MPPEFAFVIALVLLLCLMLGVAIIFLTLARPWLRAVLYGTPVPLVTIFAMRLRGNPPLLLVESYIVLKRSGVATTIGEVESVYVDSRTRVRDRDDLVELVQKQLGTTAD